MFSTSLEIKLVISKIYLLRYLSPCNGWMSCWLFKLQSLMSVNRETRLKKIVFKYRMYFIILIINLMKGFPWIWWCIQNFFLRFSLMANCPKKHRQMCKLWVVRNVLKYFADSFLTIHLNANPNKPVDLLELSIDVILRTLKYFKN